MKTGNQLGSDWLELSNLELDCNVPPLSATTGQVQLAGVGSLASGGPQPGVGQVLLGKPPDQHPQNCTHICSVQPCWVLVGELSNDWLCVAQCIIIISNTRNTGNSNTAHKQRTINSENASISSLLFSPLLTSVTTHVRRQLGRTHRGNTISPLCGRSFKV